MDFLEKAKDIYLPSVAQSEIMDGEITFVTHAQGYDSPFVFRAKQTGRLNKKRLISEGREEAIVSLRRICQTHDDLRAIYGGLDKIEFVELI